MAEKPNAPAALRNSEPILQVIRDEFEGCRNVLEIGSGTGQHAVFFASEMPWLCWQTSDLPENHEGINAWITDSGLANVKRPLELNVEDSFKADKKFDGVFSANTSHIMSIESVQRMFEIAGDCLDKGGKFCLYGPFNLNGEYTSESNKDFDASLKSQNPVMGIRDLAVLDGFAKDYDMHRSNLYAMPANNMIAVWSKTEKS